MFKSLLPWKHTKTKVMVPEQTMEDEQGLQELKLIPCSTCARTFLPLPLKKHAPVCEKNAAKKRKVFDSLKQRVEGTDLAQFHQKSYLKRQDSTPKTAEKVKKPSRWEESHQKLVDAIRTAKGAARDMSPTKKQSVTTPSNERCPHCERQFGPKAFDRHVEWCKEHRTRIQKSPANVLLAKERLEARTKYKVPPLKSKKTMVKEKYSSGTLVQRTESICSVKSTPTNPLRRTLSVRKPRSVIDLGKSPKVVTSPVQKKVEVKSLRSKKYCPPREKINLVHNENLESITVSPVKLNGFPKKLVTWKEVSLKTSDEVIVVYENTDFTSLDATKSEDFIDELKEILTTEDDTLASEANKIAKSSKSLSFPEIKSGPIIALPKTQSLVLKKQISEYSVPSLEDLQLDSVTTISHDFKETEEWSVTDFENYLGDVEALTSYDDFSRKMGESQSSLDADFAQFCEEKGRDFEESGDKISLEEPGEASPAISTRLKNTAEKIFGSLTSLSEVKTSDEPVTDQLEEPAEFCSSIDSSISETIQDDKSSEFCKDQKEDEESFSCDSLALFAKITFPDCEDNHSVVKSSNSETSDDDLVKYFAPLRPPFVSISESSISTSDREPILGVFRFSKPAVDNTGSVLDYEVPKKRRKLNTTFIVNEPKIFHKAEETIKLPQFERISTARANKAKVKMRVKTDISSVYLSYQSAVSPPPPQYDPFISAERQFMELLECDSIKPTAAATKPLIARPHTTAHNSVKTAKKFVKSAVGNKKRASVIDPPACFQDSDAGEDEFEMLENLINDQFNNENRVFSGNKQDKNDLNVILNQRKYSDTSSVDSSLINENDNLSIPEHFKFANYSPDSSEDTDITLQNDDVDLYSIQYDKKIEGTKERSNKTKPKSNFSGSGDASLPKKRTKNLETVKTPLKTKGKNNKVSESPEPSVKPEDLFAVDDKMYAEYKIYEEMYLKEKEQAANTKKHRNKNPIKSYGIDIMGEETPQTNKVSDDSAYGSLNRNSPKPRTRLSPLRQRMDSASSSGSEIIPPPLNQQRMSRFCHECGNKYPVTTAKFCPECGVKRLLL